MKLPMELVQAMSVAYGVAPETVRAALDENERVKYDLRRRHRRLRARAAGLRARL